MLNVPDKLIGYNSAAEIAAQSYIKVYYEQGQSPAFVLGIFQLKWHEGIIRL